MCLKMSSYDGVYATPEQRVGGGGCLDLPGALARELGLEEGSISGTWDFAHNLQVGKYTEPRRG